MAYVNVGTQVAARVDYFDCSVAVFPPVFLQLCAGMFVGCEDDAFVRSNTRPHVVKEVVRRVRGVDDSV